VGAGPAAAPAREAGAAAPALPSALPALSALPAAVPTEPLICKDVADANGLSYGGFRPSSKLVELRGLLVAVPPGDKVLVFSFFKGFLDLAEGMLEAELDIRCARFDGDIGPDEKTAQLARFKAEPDVRVLLATIHSGGVGLNIIEANHVFFCDRWFNPQVMEQAVCRVHRIGQTKEVRVVYLDAQGTFDEVMKTVMNSKRSNSEIVLADGVTAIGAPAAGGGGVGYKDLGNLIFRELQAMVARRDGVVAPMVDFEQQAARRRRRRQGERRGCDLEGSGSGSESDGEGERYKFLNRFVSGGGGAGERGEDEQAGEAPPRPASVSAAGGASPGRQSHLDAPYSIVYGGWPRSPPAVGVDVKVIQTPRSIFCMAIH
jgi:hypothetical protein